VPQIEGGRWDGIARKLFDISSPVAVPNLSDEVIPTFEIQNWEPELYALRRERLLLGSTAIGPSAGEFSHVGLTNPLGSESLVVVEKIVISGDSTASFIFFGALSNEQLTTSLGWGELVYGNRDLRWPGGGTPSATLAAARFVSLNAAVAQGVNVFTGTVESAAPRPLEPFPLILAPNTGLLFRPAAQATQMRVGMFWRERPFNSQERP